MAGRPTQSTTSCPRPTARRWPSASRPADRKTRTCSSTTRPPARRSPDRSTAPSSAHLLERQFADPLFRPPAGAPTRRVADATSIADATLDAWDLTSPPVPLCWGRPPVTDRLRRPPRRRPWRSFPAPRSPSWSPRTACRTRSRRGPPRSARPRGPTRRGRCWRTVADGVTGLDARGDEHLPALAQGRADLPGAGAEGGPAAGAGQGARARQPRAGHRRRARRGRRPLCRWPATGVYSHLLRIPAGSDRIEEVALPVHGHVGEVFTDPRVPGVIVALESWTTAAHPSSATIPPTAASPSLHWASAATSTRAGFEVSDLQARATTASRSPLSLIQPKARPGRSSRVVEAYGSYGISNLADFSARRAAMMKEGITYAICHVRGGGELGEAWRLGGKDANKPNTWRDLIACGEDLIARGVTDPRQALHHRRLGRRHHHGPGDDRAAGPVRRRHRPRPGRQLDPRRIHRRAVRSTFPSSGRSRPSRASTTFTRWTPTCT